MRPVVKGVPRGMFYSKNFCVVISACAFKHSNPFISELKTQWTNEALYPYKGTYRGLLFFKVPKAVSAYIVPSVSRMFHPTAPPAFYRMQKHSRPNSVHT